MDIRELLIDSLCKNIEGSDNIIESQAKEIASLFFEKMQLKNCVPTDDDILYGRYYDLIDEIHHFTGTLCCDDTFFWLADVNGRFSDFKYATSTLFQESSNPDYINLINKIINDFDFIQEYPEEEILFYRAPMNNKAFLDKIIFNAYIKGEAFWKNELQYLPRREKEKCIKHTEMIYRTIPVLKDKSQCFLSYLYDSQINDIPDFYDSATLRTLAEEELKRSGF